MLHTRLSIHSGAATTAMMLPRTVDVGAGILEDVTSTRQRLAAERAIDDVLNGSFPASDPPSWNAGRMNSIVALLSCDENRHRATIQRSLGDTPEQQMANTACAPCSHDQQLGARIGEGSEKVA